MRPTGVICKTCGADPGEPCRDRRTGWPLASGVHTARRRRWHRVAVLHAIGEGTPLTASEIAERLWGDAHANARNAALLLHRMRYEGLVEMEARHHKSRTFWRIKSTIEALKNWKEES